MSHLNMVEARSVSPEHGGGRQVAHVEAGPDPTVEQLHCQMRSGNTKVWS